MTAPTTIRVTAEHIKQGTPEDCDTCPIALAILGQCADGVYVTVAGSDVALFGAGLDVMADLPQEARAFIGRFDSRRPVEPFEFTLTWRDAP